MDTDLHRLIDADIQTDPGLSATLFCGLQSRFVWTWFAALSNVLCLLGSSFADDRVTLPNGFQLTQVATDDLATNIFCMIAAPDGGVLVSGPGYIKKLVDSDGDRVFDRAELVSAFPKSGAQGMAVDGDDLLCVGDGGIWRLPGVMKVAAAKEQNTKPPALLFEISTQGEHHAHSIQQGPGGWWYHIAGNHAEFDEASCDGTIKERRAGVVMRFSPDFSQRQTMAHGFRNAYDFAFNSTDQLFTFDSDGERDLGLPWYRPTRVFEIVPGDDAGWVSKTWKRPSHYFDMPRLIGDAGRASPTGVTCYDGKQFPIDYDDAIFLGDWTFGRVLVCRRELKSGKYLPPEDFLIPKDSFGFPVTDLAVANDGSLLVSVGGRGTEGGVWRVAASSKRKELDEPLGKYIWQQKKTYAQDQTVPNLIEEAQKSLEESAPAAQVDALASLLVEADQLDVSRDGKALLGIVEKASMSNDPGVIAATLRLLEALCVDQPWVDLFSPRSDGNLSQNRLNNLVMVAARKGVDDRLKLVRLLINQIGSDGGKGSNPNLFSDDVSCRLAQIVLGGVGESGGFCSSISANRPVDLKRAQREEMHDAIFEKMKLTDSTTTMMELGRLAAMQRLPSDTLAQSCLQNIDPDFLLEKEKEDVELGLGFARGKNVAAKMDLYWLSCFLQLERSDDDRVVSMLAKCLMHLEKNFRRKKVNTDSHFGPMLDEIASVAFKKYPALPKLLLSEKRFGGSHHGYLFSEFSDDDLPLLQQKVVAYLEGNLADATNDHVQVLARKPTIETAGVLRQLAKKQILKDATILALTRCGDESDQPLFVDGLESLDPKVQKESAIALRKLVPGVSVGAAANTLRTAMRLGNERQDVLIRDQMILLLRKFTGRDFGYQLRKPDLRQGNVLRRWRAFLIEQHPELADALKPAETGRQQLARLEKLDWDSGVAARGKLVYEKLQCAACHGAARALGPRLEGVTKRLGRNDLLTAIVNPDAQVSDRYRTTLFETFDGQLVSGTIVYENVDGVTVRESSGKTARLNRDQIETRRRSARSIMPTGLLDQATDQEVTDLMAFLKTL